MMRSAATAGMACSVALMFLLLASPIQAHLPHQARRRMTATAVSTAEARDGASVSADSSATGSGTSVVNAKGSGSVEVACRQSAKDNEELYKACINNNGNTGGSTAGGAAGSASGASASATGSTTVPWAQAPRCTKPASAYKVVFDNSQPRRPWGFEENKTSCALRDENGNPTATA